MTLNVLQVPAEIVAIVVGTLVLIFGAVALALPHRPKTLPGSSGRREGKEGMYEEIRPDEYIESFNKQVESSAGSAPRFVWLVLAGIIIWWVVYLIVNWTPR
jgi:hypothetical protein